VQTKVFYIESIAVSSEYINKIFPGQPIRVTVHWPAGMDASGTKCALMPCIGLPACHASVRRYARAAYRALLRR